MKFNRRIFEIAILGLILVAITSPITKEVFSQVAPIRGEVSVGNYTNIKAGSDGSLATNWSGMYSEGAITVSSVAQTLIPVNSSRRGLVVSNTNNVGAPFYFSFSPITVTRAGFLLSGVGATLQFTSLVSLSGISFSAPAATSGWVVEIQ